MASVKTITQVRPVHKGVRSNIPFLDSDPDAFLIRYQEDFKPFSIERPKPFNLVTAEVFPKNLRNFNENLTEMMESYKPHSVPQVTYIPRWTKWKTNFKMHAGPGQMNSFTTQYQDDSRPRPFQLPLLPCRPPSVIKKPVQGEKLPESSCQASYIPHHIAPVVKARVKHLEEGSAAIRVDERQHNFVSDYSTNFQGARGSPAQSLIKLIHTTPPVHLPKSDLITKSHVQFSSPHLSGLYYTTTSKEDYSKKDAVRPRAIVHQPSNTPKRPGMTLSSIKSFMLELDGPADAAFTGGEVVSGQVVLDLRRDTRVHSMKVQGRGVATAHWLENRGMNSVYNDYTSKITYFRKRQHLIRGQW
ncbi:hypothetical protein GBF38_007509 [Nibea albiflora]|uniref:Uncharacterized protein n=1 Tax=Nibea albiflora TaxID=240163 RepID=A0ACB7EMI6_NIBAL|nr:hypothetical protein GBF38_007509 [Nibea albiflora]